MLFTSYLNLFVFIPATWVGHVSGAVLQRAPYNGVRDLKQHLSKDARAASLGFILQTGTALHQTDGTFQILLGDINNDGRPDLVAIKTSNTGTRSTEIHVLSGSSNYQNFILQTGTGLQETSTSQFDFLLADWDGDGKLDLVAIKKYGTGTRSTEVHILSGASNFRSFILQTGTALHETDDTFAFGVGNWDGDGKPDIFAIKKSATGTRSTEIHVLRGSANYQSFALQTGTALGETDATFDFTVGDWNADGRPDVVAVKKSNTGTGSTEIHVLSGASSFQNFILQSGTALGPTDGTFEFGVGDYNRDGKLDLFAFKKSNTGTSSTEVHVLGG
ncbi:FG-GAP repeat domain-containing protein [Pyrenochaeta sp. MPI-SDFR-AT-0127]|nr:FG-GAP repeat domain-containing protein [Pyrenochaeta sp. MPI-SDFR-AT-0127]